MEFLIVIPDDKGKRELFFSWIRNSRNDQLWACKLFSVWFCYFFQLNFSKLYQTSLTKIEDYLHNISGTFQETPCIRLARGKFEAIDLFRLYILFSQYRSRDDTQEIWSFVLFIKKSTCLHVLFLMNKTKDQISWVSSRDLYWENKMYKRKRSIRIQLAGKDLLSWRQVNKLERALKSDNLSHWKWH